MAKIIVLGAMKGGVGKSVSAFNLAYSLAELGKTVLAVDFDSQANLSTCMGVEDTAAVPVTIGHLMMNQIEEEEQPEPEEYIMSRKGVDFIPSSMVLSVVDAKLRIEMGAERILAGILEPLRNRYDYILIVGKKRLQVHVDKIFVHMDLLLLNLSVPGGAYHQCISGGR